MKYIGTQGTKILKIIHLFFCIIWVGGAISLMLLLFSITPTESHEMYLHSLSIQLIDDWLIIPGAIGCFLTGLVYSIWTKWGFFKHNWITVKWIFTVALILIGTFVTGPWVNANVYEVSEISNYSLDNVGFWNNVRYSKILGPFQVSCLLFIVVISVLKPWKKKSIK